MQASRGDERGGIALAACEIAYQSLRESGLPASSWLTSEETRKAIAIYNTALAMFVFEYSKKLAGGTATLSVQTPLGPRIVAARYASDSRYTAGYFEELIPSDYVWLTGFRRRTRVDGLGVPLVGVREHTEARKAELRFQPPNRDVFVALGCFAEFEPRRDGSRMDITLFDLDRTSTVQIGREFIPLAADFTAPLALASGGMNDLMLGIRAILNVGASADVKGIYLIEPFDPNRIPVLLLHGLMSSPLVWRNAATAAMKDPIIRRNYQFWYAFYSTGVPVTQSAALIRNRIAFIRRLGDPSGKSRASKNMVIIGYSMGGIIARILATDMGDQFWAAVSSKPFDQVKLEPEDRKELQDLIFWKPVPGVKEVVFLATPHRGTRMADASFAQLGRKLVGLPASLLRFQNRVLSAVVDVLDGVKVTRRSITGIDSLPPLNVFIINNVRYARLTKTVKWENQWANFPRSSPVSPDVFDVSLLRRKPTFMFYQSVCASVEESRSCLSFFSVPQALSRRSKLAVCAAASFGEPVSNRGSVAKFYNCDNAD